MPLQSLLNWLLKPKGPTLMEASVKAVPYKALAIEVTKRMLYEEKPPLVGVGLVYKLHYISTVLFSAAYMHLNVWHSAGSNEESENRLNAPCLLFMNISKIVGEDFTKSLIALHTDLEAFCEALVSDIARTMDLHPDDPMSCQVKAALHKFQQTTSLKVTLPLMELEAAGEDMEEFMRSHL